MRQAHITLFAFFVGCCCKFGHEVETVTVKIDMPVYNISPTATLAERAVCRFR